MIVMMMASTPSLNASNRVFSIAVILNLKVKSKKLI